jgi:curved DNA-binding protein CbpA
LAAKAVKKDHYSVLGVTPASEDVVIRAAYHALMRRYHPDADPTQEGAELSRAINEAYAVLRDPAKRARYDESLGSRDLKFEPAAHSPPPKPLRSRLAPAAAMGVALLAVGMVVFAVSPPIGQSPAPKPQLPAEIPAVSATKPVPAKAAQRPAKLAAGSCAASEASRLIKDELFRRAGGLRDFDPAQLRHVADHASFRIDTARLKAEQNGVMDCSSWIALDLPPGLVVDGGRTNLNAELSYALAHDRGRLRIASLSGEGRLVRTLATLGPAPREPEQDKPIEPAQVASSTTRKAPVVVAEAKRSTAVTAVRAPRTLAKSPPVPVAPSVCSGSRAEQIVCANTNLSSLDRQLSLLYRQSWNQADEKKRAALLGTRQRFNDRRQACASPNCMTTAYLSRLKEISDIMAGRKLQ